MQIQRAAVARPPADRFLLGIVAGIILLVLLAVAAVLLLQQPAPMLAADSPGGTVQRFYLALDAHDFGAAYNLISPAMANRPAFADFVRYNEYRTNDERRIRLAGQTQDGDSATVNVTITGSDGSGGLFGNGQYSDSEGFTLHHAGDGWRIVELPTTYYPFTGN